MNLSPLVFVHIPKAAGTTLRHVIRKQYGENRIVNVRAFRSDVLDARMQERRKNVRLDGGCAVVGHMIFGAHRHLDGVSYVTMVRSAVERVISDYYYVRRTPSHDFYDPVVTEDYSLEEYVRSGITIYTNNVQTRMLAGVGREVPFGECSANMLERAKRNIEEHFSVVGTTSRFDESVVLMKRKLGWGIPLYMTRNRTSERPGRQALDSSTIEVIRKYNTLDEQLFEYAEERLGRQIEEEGQEEIAWELEKVNWANKIYSPSAHLYVRLRRAYNRIMGRNEW